jgi:putative nucleotidyltransferase with HDIG domain
LATQVETKLKQERLLRIIEEELQDLPSLPAVVVRVMETINDPSTSAPDLNRLISTDAALAGKILRLVNSSYYGFPRKITTITHAIVILGFSTVRNLATSLGVVSGFGASNTVSALDREAFWSHSVAVASSASLIARRKNASAKVLEEVFIGGLLHDIGKLFLDQYFSHQYAVAIKLARAANISIWEAEKTALGVGHVLVGKRVAEKWNLPPSLTAMISLHHQCAYAKEYMEIVSIVHAADYLARRAKLGNGGDNIVPVVAPEVQQWLNFSPEVWETLEAETIAKYDGSQDFLRAMLGK